MANWCETPTPKRSGWQQAGDWLLCALAGAIVALALLWPLLGR